MDPDFEQMFRKTSFLINILDENNIKLSDASAETLSYYLPADDIQYLFNIALEIGKREIHKYVVYDDFGVPRKRANAVLKVLERKNLSLYDVDEKFLSRYLTENEIKSLYELAFVLGKELLSKYRLKQSQGYTFDFGIQDNKLKWEGAANTLLGLEKTNDDVQNFNLEWTEITPYGVLGIQEGEYSKEELLAIMGNKINFINAHEIDEEKKKREIDSILNAYNEIIKGIISKK